jgi:3-phenylpropionate/trans-cinnamate dioxygenase ferredoxin subunit
MEKNDFVSCLKESQLTEGHMKAVRIKGRPILLVRVGGEVFGMSNICPHEGCSFEEGMLKGYLVMCPCHGWWFDVRNGQYQEIPQIQLERYRCKIENGKIHVEIKNKEK